jgi:hypothetical protein
LLRARTLNNQRSKVESPTSETGVNSDFRHWPVRCAGATPLGSMFRRVGQDDVSSM